MTRKKQKGRRSSGNASNDTDTPRYMPSKNEIARQIIHDAQVDASYVGVWKTTACTRGCRGPTRSDCSCYHSERDQRSGFSGERIGNSALGHHEAATYKRFRCKAKSIAECPGKARCPYYHRETELIERLPQVERQFLNEVDFLRFCIVHRCEANGLDASRVIADNIHMLPQLANAHEETRPAAFGASTRSTSYSTACFPCLAQPALPVSATWATARQSTSTAGEQAGGMPQTNPIPKAHTAAVMASRSSRPCGGFTVDQVAPDLHDLKVILGLIENDGPAIYVPAACG